MDSIEILTHENMTDTATFIADGEARDFYYETRARRATRRRLAMLLRARSRLVVLSADAGAGKSTLLERVRGGLDRECTTCALDARDGTRARDVLGALLRSLGEDGDDIPVGVQISRLGVRLATLTRRTLLIVDDAQRLQADVLGVLMALASKPRGAPGLSVLLVGRPRLLARLQGVACTWADKLSIDLLDLPPLQRDEVADYVHLRVHRDGAPGDAPFNDTLIDWLAEASHGHPGWIDSLAAHALYRIDEAERLERRRLRRRRAMSWWLASGVAASAISMTVASAPSRETAMAAVSESVTPALDTGPADAFRSRISAVE
jgi:type II secretory pathway predicted ATPase ExeA